MPDDIALKTAEKYQEAWEKITGGKIIISASAATIGHDT
jgi:hypothetical protein